jgi:hypothetical protein
MEADRPRELHRAALPPNSPIDPLDRPWAAERSRELVLKDQARWADISPGSSDTRGRAALPSGAQEGIGGGT